MGDVVGFVALAGLVALGSFGWGSLLLRAALGRGAAPGRAGRVAIRIGVGLAAFLGVGGYLVALSAARFAALLAWQVVGALLGGFEVARGWSGGPRLRARLGDAAPIVVLALAAIGLNGADKLNFNDDQPAYLYLAHRLLATGSMIDPFNARRITTDGGGELFSALALRVGGAGAVPAVELGGFALLCIALVLALGGRRHAIPMALLLGLGVLVLRPVGIWANSAPTFSGVALVLTCFALCPTLGTPRLVVRAALVGLVLGALVALRLEFVPPALGAVGACCVTLPKGQRHRAGIGVLGGTLLGVGGWSIALERSSGTPLFPFVAGNWNTAFPWRPSHALGALGFARRVLAELGTARVGLFLLAAAALTVVVVGLARREVTRTDRASTILLGAIGATLLEVVFETPQLSGGALADVGRYDAPGALACALFGLAVAWHLAEETRPVAERVPQRWRTASALSALGLLATVALDSPAGYASALRSGAHGVAMLTSGSGYLDPTTTDRAAYERLNAAVPKGAKVLAAVDDPGLLDFSRFGFATLDEVGSASPSPGIPVLEGPGPVIEYLQRLGYTGIVASSWRRPGLYNRAQWTASLTSSIPIYRAEARYFLAWLNDLDAMRHDPAVGVRQLGSLVEVKFKSD